MQQDFATFFEALTGFQPLPWQAALYERFVSGDCPDSASIPTGLGKTSVVAIWLIALAMQPDVMPRRLVYVVNRRTVVDQTTTEVEKLYQRLSNKPELASLAAQLSELAALPCDTPLAISTLRGQYTDNGEWKSDPSRPAVIIGTVDLIGSGLLFSHYRAGFKTRPLYAAFLGQDVLLIHDEAHLEPAFQQLLNEIVAVQRGSDLRPLRVMALTATSRSHGRGFGLTAADLENAIVRQRLDATKKLFLVCTENIDDSIIDRVKSFKAGNILVFVRTVESAVKISVALDKGELKRRIVRLTGTMRGKERDGLVNDPRFQRFLPPQETLDADNAPVVLVATAAGEVGVNISADHCVCDLSTYESMMQRFGRVNRFGHRSDSTITVVHEAEFARKGDMEEVDERRKKTLDVLKALQGDASPRSLSAHPLPEAFSPEPVMWTATGIQFDAWSLTTIRENIAARPSVAPYLHGDPKCKWQPPETHIAWRDDWDFLFIQDRDGFLEDFPLHSRELLRDRTSRIVDTLAKLIASRFAELDSSTAAWLISENGEVTNFPLKSFDKRRAEIVLANATLVLPSSLGGLEDGMFTGKGSVDDASGIERRESSSRKDADFFVDISGEDSSEPKYLLWYMAQDDKTLSPSQSTRSSVPVELDSHTAAVEANVRAIAAKLDLPIEVQAALIKAAKHHDDGKARRLWQSAIGNGAYPDVVLAKSTTPARAYAEAYRHELGSVIDIRDSKRRNPLAEHLMVAHHGRARPHIPSNEIYDPEATLDVALSVATGVPICFAELQRRYGRWGLAFLESVLRAADYAASAGIKAAEERNAPWDQSDSNLISSTSSSSHHAIQLEINSANPGHFFACCGLFEIASSMFPEATCCFQDNRFELFAPTSLNDLFGRIAAAEIQAVDESDKALSPVRIADFGLNLDWWRHEGGGIGKLKTWAGQMSVAAIANDMKQAVGKAIAKPDFAYDEVFLWYSRDCAGQPYYFDANYAVNAQAQDVGFSVDKLGKGGVKIIPAIRPAVELLCLIGLQRARPILAVDERGRERLYDYRTWEQPISITLLPAAIAGLLPHCAKHYHRFANPSRAKDYRAFMPATLLNP